MNKHYNKQLVPLAKNLRKNMTKEECRLWYDYLKTHSARFTRQKVFQKYILDFYCAKAKLAIELDGAQHYEPEMRKRDEERTAFLEQHGIKVVRFSNFDIHSNFQAVCEYIDYLVKEEKCDE